MTPVYSAHLSTLFTELVPEARPGAATEAGFTHVESWWPPAEDPLEWAALVRGAGLVAAALNADGGDLATGERGYCNRPERRDEVLAAVDAAARVVTAAGGRNINLLVGRQHDDAPLPEQLDAAVATVGAAAEVAAGRGARLVIEHLNPVDVDRPLLPTPHDAAAFVTRVGHPDVQVLFDAYHAAAAGLDPLAELHRITAPIGHVQYADFPGRGAPGTGTTSLPALMAALDRIGYRGAVGLEFVPGASTASALAQVSGLG